MQPRISYKILFITSIIIVFFIFLFSLLISQLTTKTATNTPPLTPEKKAQASGFTVVSPIKNGQTLQNISIVAPVILEFSRTIDPTSIDYTIKPSIPLELELQPAQAKLFIYPKEAWQSDVLYTFTITKLKDITGKPLENKFQIQFRPSVGTDDDAVGGNSPEANNNPSSPTPAP